MLAVPILVVDNAVVHQVDNWCIKMPTVALTIGLELKISFFLQQKQRVVIACAARTQLGDHFVWLSSLIACSSYGGILDLIPSVAR